MLHVKVESKGNKGYLLTNQITFTVFVIKLRSRNNLKIQMKSFDALNYKGDKELNHSNFIREEKMFTSRAALNKIYPKTLS